jgi:hypothetical protein
MLKKANKWLRDTIKPYKYENQKIRDQRQIIDGIVNFVVGGIKIIFQLINLMIIVPIKALVADWRNFTVKYKEIGQGDISKIEPTFQRMITGFVQILTSPIIPFRIILRLFLTPKDGVSVFSNNGLKTIVDEYFKDTPEPEQNGIRSFAAVMGDKIPDNIVIKAKKYDQNKQKDIDQLNKILAKPTLTYYKMREIKARIEQETSAKSRMANTTNVSI